jgi:uncharacterized protein (DUF736 family)
MAYDKTEYDPTNRGALFVNDKKDQDNFPDFKGSLNVDGTDYWISAWKKKSKDGQSFLSISVRTKQDAPRQSSQPTRKAPKDDFSDLSF